MKTSKPNNDTFVLENAYIRVELDRTSGALKTSPTTAKKDEQAGQQMPYCYFVTYGSRHTTHPASLRLKSLTFVNRTPNGTAKAIKDLAATVNGDYFAIPPLKLRGALAPTGEYYVTSFLMTEKTFTLADGSTETALMPVGSQCFDTPISYTNINQPDAPASADLTPAGNEVMRAKWSAVDGADGSFEIPGTLDGNQNTRVLPLQAQDSAGNLSTPQFALVTRRGTTYNVTITPDKGYVVSSVKIDGKSVGAVKSYTLTNVMGSHAITVTFRKAGSPASGDSGGLPLWNALLCASAFGLACAVFPRRKRRLG